MLGSYRKRKNASSLVIYISGIIFCVLVSYHKLNQRPDTNYSFSNTPTASLIDTKFDYLTFHEDKLWYKEKLTHTEDFPLSAYTAETKKILVWTENWPHLPNPFCDNRINWFKEYGCPVWQCQVVPWDKHGKNLKESGILVEDFDAVIFHDPHWFNSSQVPAKRSPHQRYIFWTTEPPGLHSYLKLWDDSADFFNWTMTYRWDSDIINPYGYTRRKTEAEMQSQNRDLRKKNYAKGKSKMAVWFATNCRNTNGRLEYTHRLQRYISVDIYGECGPRKCPKDKQLKCRQMMGRKYKFYIAFENSLCYDYVTEKIFYNVKFDIIPIVMDLHGNYARFAPAKSYINALDFPTVRHLADYLKILDKNDTLYSEYFWWKEHYVMEYSLHQYELNIYEASARGLCGLCSKLHNPLEPDSIVRNLKKWWFNDSTCKVIKFPNNYDNDSWIVENYDPPYNVKVNSPNSKLFFMRTVQNHATVFLKNKN